MCLERVDGFLGGVGAVIVGGELVFNVVELEEGTEGGGAFIVGDLEGGFQTTLH